MQSKSSVSNGFSENDADMARILGVKGVIVGGGNRRVVGAQYAVATGARALEQGRRLCALNAKFMSENADAQLAFECGYRRQREATVKQREKVRRDEEKKETAAARFEHALIALNETAAGGLARAEERRQGTRRQKIEGAVAGGMPKAQVKVTNAEHEHEEEKECGLNNSDDFDDGGVLSSAEALLAELQTEGKRRAKAQARAQEQLERRNALIEAAEMDLSQIELQAKEFAVRRQRRRPENVTAEEIQRQREQRRKIHRALLEAQREAVRARRREQNQSFQQNLEQLRQVITGAGEKEVDSRPAAITTDGGGSPRMSFVVREPLLFVDDGDGCDGEVGGTRGSISAASDQRQQACNQNQVRSRYRQHSERWTQQRRQHNEMWRISQEQQARASAGARS